MKLLLDTHIFLWYISGDASLPISLRDDIRDANNEVYLSAASVWEVVIKFALGKLPLPEPPASTRPISSKARFAALRTGIDQSSAKELP
jgi:PIN domain nuclease of toxin-antitoxin system